MKPSLKKLFKKFYVSLSEILLELKFLKCIYEIDLRSHGTQ